MAEAESEEAVSLRKKASEMLKGPSSIAHRTSKEHESSCFPRISLAKMANEDPMRLQNQSCVIHEDIVKTKIREQRVYSSLARLSTFSVGLSSTHLGECLPRAPSHESSDDPKDKSPHRYFQMPDLGARVFVGDVDGLDTIAVFGFHGASYVSNFDFKYAKVRSLYKDDRRGGLSAWLRAQPAEFWRSGNYLNAILSGTELFVAPDDHFHRCLVVGNLGQSSSASGSSSDYNDSIGNKTIRQPSDIVEQPRAPRLRVCEWGDQWITFEPAPNFLRPIKGSYWKKPKFTKSKYQRSKYNSLEGGILQLTRFDDFVILGNDYLGFLLPHRKFIDIVQKNASETANVIAAQLVKAVIEKMWAEPPVPITVIVIILDLKEILLGEHKKAKEENMAIKVKHLFFTKEISQRLGLKDDKKIAKSKEEEKRTIVEEEEKMEVFASEMEDKKVIKMEVDHKVKMLGEPLPNVPRVSTISLEENELGMKSTAINSNLTSAKGQDDSEASTSVVLTIDGDCKNKDFMASYPITKWIIHGDLQERTLLCVFCMKEKQYEFYFEDHESMATIIGLGVPHSKVILESMRSHVTVVEIPEEDWNKVWAHPNVISLSIPEGNVLKQEQFPNILHCIANVINANNSVNMANNGVAGGDNGKDKAQGNADASKDKGKSKAHDHDVRGNTCHPSGGSNGLPDDNDKKERKEKDGNDDKKDGHDRNDGKTFNDCKKVETVVHVYFLPGGILKEKIEMKESKKKDLEKTPKKEEKNGKNLNLKNLKALWHCGILTSKLGENGNVARNQLKSTTIEGLDNGNVDGNNNLIGSQRKSTTIEGVENGDEVEVELGKKKDYGEIHEEGLGCAFAQAKNSNVGNLQESTTIEGVENGNVDGNGNLIGSQRKSATDEEGENGDVIVELKKQLEDQIHSQMVFTFTIKDETGGELKSIQATIDPISFQLPFDNKDNYLQRSRFGWFHDYLQVSFGVVKPNVAMLETKSCKLYNTVEGKETISQSIAQGNASTRTIEKRIDVGGQYYAKVIGRYGTTKASGVQTNQEVNKSLEKTIMLTEGGFIFSRRTDKTSKQLEYSCCPYFPFKEDELIYADDCLEMYKDPICQLQELKCEGTWIPDCSENLEEYKLEASRELRMTRIYDLEPKIQEEEKQKLVWKAKPLCYIQKLKKVVYLNHAMSHLTSSTTLQAEYRLRERPDPNNSSRTILTKYQKVEKLEWPSNDPLIVDCP